MCDAFLRMSYKATSFDEDKKKKTQRETIFNQHMILILFNNLSDQLQPKINKLINLDYAYESKSESVFLNNLRTRSLKNDTAF